MQIEDAKLEQLGKTISMLSVDAVQKAESGHPGLPMGASLYAGLLWGEFLRFNPKEPRWPNRDRFVLSAGHGSMLLYSLLHLFNYDLPLSELQSFRQWESKTPGHPEFGYTPGVEATTGPLGQGIGNSVGMALGGKLMAAEYGADLFNYRVFALVSDGDLMEGLSSEVGSLAGHWGLGNLIVLYDDNNICLAGKTKDCFTEDVPARFSAFGWQTLSVNADDINGLRSAIEAGIKEQSKPTLISVKSIIGLGSPNKSNSASAHGSPLGAEEVALTKQALGWPTEPLFYIPESVTQLCSSLVKAKQSEFDKWTSAYDSWKKTAGEKAQKLEAQLAREIPSSLREKLLNGLEQKGSEATRELSGKTIQLIAAQLPAFIGGSADLEPSTKTSIKDSTDIQAGSFSGRNVRYGVREHGMAAIANGLAYEQSWIPMVSTFLVFSDYLRPSVRLAALSHLQVLYVFTHDSIWVGEDGPTHEPIEHIQSLRLIPNLDVFRPADGIETAVAYLAALERKDGPTALVFSRQGLPVLERSADFDAASILKGAYVLRECIKEPDLTIVATGSEVGLALQVSDQLAHDRVNARVVSIPCVERFKAQEKEYRDQVIPDTIPCVTLEAGVTIGWAGVVGPCSLNLGIDRFGASAPGDLVAEKLGLNVEVIVERIKDFLHTL